MLMIHMVLPCPKAGVNAGMSMVVPAVAVPAVPAATPASVPCQLDMRQIWQAEFSAADVVKVMVVPPSVPFETRAYAWLVSVVPLDCV